MVSIATGKYVDDRITFHASHPHPGAVSQAEFTAVIDALNSKLEIIDKRVDRVEWTKPSSEFSKSSRPE